MGPKRLVVVGLLLSLSLCFAGAAPFVSSRPSIGTPLDNVFGKRQFATFGPHLSMGQTDSEYIKMTTTFVPGHPPAMMVGSLFIWPGLFDQKNRSEGDLIQTVAEFTDRPKMQQTCNAGAGQWYTWVRLVTAQITNKIIGAFVPLWSTLPTSPRHLRMEKQ
jgi:hypothetical protein